ncbi:hypothetical protein GJ496_006803 [Pomphorhynchus laevis]|nr:hypothetical protein GJ496_006803 [Pomphorhynchus laevis]
MTTVANQQLNNDFILGLLNSNSKYLTAESFGNQINASGNHFKSRQKWKLTWCDFQDNAVVNGNNTVQPINNGNCRVQQQQHQQITNVIALSSVIQKCFVAADKNGNINCYNTNLSKECMFFLHVNNNGKWSFQHCQLKQYLGGTDDMLNCNSRVPIWWTVQFDWPVTVSIYNFNRKRYVQVLHRQNDDCFYLAATNKQGWSTRSVFSLRFSPENGHYAMFSVMVNAFLNEDGTLTMYSKDSNPFILNIRVHNRKFVFKLSSPIDIDSKTLSVCGHRSELEFKCQCGTGDSCFFAIEQARFQFFMRSILNDKYLSTRQGLSVIANQTYPNDNNETFQLNPVPSQLLHSSNEMCLLNKYPLYKISDHSERFWAIVNNMLITQDLNKSVKSVDHLNKHIAASTKTSDIMIQHNIFRIDQSITGNSIIYVYDVLENDFKQLIQLPTGYFKASSATNGDHMNKNNNEAIERANTDTKYTADGKLCNCVSLTLNNRRIIALRCQFGYIGFSQISSKFDYNRSVINPDLGGSRKIACNLTNPEYFTLEYDADSLDGYVIWQNVDKYHLFICHSENGLILSNLSTECVCKYSNDKQDPARKAVFHVIIYMDGMHILLSTRCNDGLHKYVQTYKDGHVGFTTDKNNASIIQI